MELVRRSCSIKRPPLLCIKMVLAMSQNEPGPDPNTNPPDNWAQTPEGQAAWGARFPRAGYWFNVLSSHPRIPSFRGSGMDNRIPNTSVPPTQPAEPITTVRVTSCIYSDHFTDYPFRVFHRFHRICKIFCLVFVILA